MHLVCPVLLTEADFIITTKHQNYQGTPPTFTAPPPPLQPALAMLRMMHQHDCSAIFEQISLREESHCHPIMIQQSILFPYIETYHVNSDLMLREKSLVTL